MATHRLLQILVLLLAACVSSQCAGADADADADTDADGGSSADLAARLRRQWQVSVREGRLRSRGSTTSQQIRSTITKQLLYCRVGIGYHLQILPNGSVGGVHEHSEYSWLRVFAMQQGVVGILGLRSGLYLCMTPEGIPQGSERFTDDCLFSESLEENLYSTYATRTHPGFYLALSHLGEPKRGSSVKKEQPCTHFLPRTGV